MDTSVRKIGEVTIQKVKTDKDVKHDEYDTMSFDSDTENSLSDEESIIKEHNSNFQSIKRKNEFENENCIKKCKSTPEHNSTTDLHDFNESLNENIQTHLQSDHEDCEYDSEEDSETEDVISKMEPAISIVNADKSDFIDKLADLGETSTSKSDNVKSDSEYDYDITEKLKEMGEISVETVKKGEKPRKSDNEEIENEISVTPAKKDSGSDSDDKLSSEKKIGNMRRNIREVMDETQLDEATLAAQRQEMERLRRVQEQQRIIREVQRQIAFNRQNNKTQHRVISLLQGNSTLIKQIPSSSNASSGSSTTSGSPGTSSMSSGKIGGTVLLKLPNGETKSMTRLPKGGAPFEVLRFQKGAIQGKMQRNLIPIKRTVSGNLTPSVSIAPVTKKLEIKQESDSDSEFSDTDKKFKKVAGKPKDVVTISSSSDDDCIVLSEEEPEEPEPEEDPCNSGMHTNDSYNVPDAEGRVLINVGHPENEDDIFLAPQIARVIKPHQIGGVRFLYDNVIESIDRFKSSPGFGCILAHSMGLGKTLQIVCFSDIFLRHTGSRTILCIMPINTLQNWMAEFNMWLPKDTTNSPLLSHGEVRSREFNLYVLNDSHKTLAARAKVIQEWHKDGGVLLIGYELYRLLSLRKNPKSKSKRKKPGAANDQPDTPDDEEKNKTLFEEIHEALVTPGPDLVICDEGHRIKNSHASISQALKQIRSKRRIVLTGYPLQNNLLEYWCMVDFVRPNYLGTKTEFSNMFERPIQNGQCIDSTPQDIRLMRYRAHVLHSLLEGFVQRRSHAVLQTSLPQKEEYVLLVRMTEFQRKLYDTFMNDFVRTRAVPNPLKAFAVCCKIWNHPDVLYYFLKKQTAGEAVDLDLEEVAGTVGATGNQTPTPVKPKKGSSRSKGGVKKEKKTAANKSSNSSTNNSKPAASVTPNTSTTTSVSTTSTSNSNTSVSSSVDNQVYPAPPNVPTLPPPTGVQNYNQMNENYPTPPYSNPLPTYTQQNYSQYPQNNDYYNQNQNYSNNYNQNYYPNQEYGNFYGENKPEGYNLHGFQHNEQGYWHGEQNNPQNNQYYQQNGPPNDYYLNNNQQPVYGNQDYYRQNQYNPNYSQNNLYSTGNCSQNQQWNQPPEVKQEYPKPEFNQNHDFNAQSNIKVETMDNSKSTIVKQSEIENKNIDIKKETDFKEEIKSENLEQVKEEIDDKNLEKDDYKHAEAVANALSKMKEDPGIPYDWAHELMKGYIPGCIENSAKMEIFFCILQESMALGDRILLFSQSLFTLNLIEEFLQKSEIPGTSDKWTKNKHYYRLDGSTSALEREKLINEYNSNPNIYLFLVSTRAGSLGINLVGANRVIVFDASWNPCHDTQAVCRVYRYGQKKPCFVYRIVMDNCLEKRIYDRQINKQGMADRVVDECNPDAHLSMKDVTNLCWDDEKDSEVKDFSTTKDKYIDVVIQKVLDAHSHRLSKEPFQHESLLIDRKEKKLSQAEKRLAKRSYELEKQANINSRPTYNYYNNASGQGLQIRAIRSADGNVLQNKPVASVRPMQSEQLVKNLGRSGGTSTQGTRSRWIPAEVWQRQGMTAQEMTLPLDVVIPTSSPDRGSIVLKAGQKVLVLKSPKGIYMQLECGKIVAIKTAFKVRGSKAPDKGDDSSNKESAVPTTILKKLPQGANSSKSVSNNVPLPLKNNSAISVIPKGGQQRVKPFTQSFAKLNMKSIRQPVPSFVGKQGMRVGGPRYTGKIQSIQKRVQLAKTKPYNLDKAEDLPNAIDPSKIKSERVETETHVVPSSDEDIAPESQTESSDKRSESAEMDSESYPATEQFSESDKSTEACSELEHLSATEFAENSAGDKQQSVESFQNSDKSNSSTINLDQFQNSSTSPEKFSTESVTKTTSENNQNLPRNELQSVFNKNTQNSNEILPIQEPFSQQAYYRQNSSPFYQHTEKLSSKTQNEIIPEKSISPIKEIAPKLPMNPAFQIQNTPAPIPSPIAQEIGNTNRSLKNYRHNFAGQKATKSQLKATSSALHHLEQTTSAIGETKQPFQESLDNITNSYGNPPCETKVDDNILNLDNEKNKEISEKGKNKISKSPAISIVAEAPKTEISQPIPQHQVSTEQLRPPQVVQTETPIIHSHQHQLQPPLQPSNQPQEFSTPVTGSYGGYYGYGATPMQSYSLPQNYYNPPEMPHYSDPKLKVGEKSLPEQSSTLPISIPSSVNSDSPSTSNNHTVINSSTPHPSGYNVGMPPGITPTPAPVIPSVPAMATTSSVLPNAPVIPPSAHSLPGTSNPAPARFSPYGQPTMPLPPPPHGNYDMMYSQQNQYTSNYPGLPYSNQANYQPHYQHYDQAYPAPAPAPAAPNMYSAFHRPDVHPQYPADPYAQSYHPVRNYPPQYGYPPPPTAPAQNVYPPAPGAPGAPAYDYQYNANAFPPPPPSAPFVGPYNTLPNNNAIP